MNRRLGIGQIHNRGLHYVLLTHPKPDGTPYATPDWHWLGEVCNAARWLGYVPFDQIVDERNAEPVLRLWKPPQPLPYVSVDFDVVVPDADELEPYVGVVDFTGTQPYHVTSSRRMLRVLFAVVAVEINELVVVHLGLSGSPIC